MTTKPLTDWEKKILQVILATNRQCRFVSLTTQTEVRMRKTNNPFLGTQKIAYRNGLVNVHFVKSCNRKLQEMGFAANYEAQDVWHKPFQDSALRVNPKNGKLYLMFYPFRSRSTLVFQNRTITKDLIAPFLYKQSKPDFKPICCTIALDNIHSLRCNGTTIRQDDQTIAQYFGQLSAWQRALA